MHDSNVCPEQLSVRICLEPNDRNAVFQLAFCETQNAVHEVDLQLLSVDLGHDYCRVWRIHIVCIWKIDLPTKPLAKLSAAFFVPK